MFKNKGLLGILVYAVVALVAANCITFKHLEWDLLGFLFLGIAITLPGFGLLPITVWI